MTYIVSRRKKISSRWVKIYVLFISFFLLKCCHHSQSNVVRARSIFYSSLGKQKYFILYNFKSGQWRGNKKLFFMQKTFSKLGWSTSRHIPWNVILNTSTHTINSYIKSSNGFYLWNWFSAVDILHRLISFSSYKYILSIKTILSLRKLFCC